MTLRPQQPISAAVEAQTLYHEKKVPIWCPSPVGFVKYGDRLHTYKFCEIKLPRVTALPTHRRRRLKVMTFTDTRSAASCWWPPAAQAEQVVQER